MAYQIFLGYLMPKPLYIYIYIYKLDLALNKFQGLICNKTQADQINFSIDLFYLSMINIRLYTDTWYQIVVFNTNNLQTFFAFQSNIIDHKFQKGLFDRQIRAYHSGLE